MIKAIVFLIVCAAIVWGVTTWFGKNFLGPIGNKPVPTVTPTSAVTPAVVTPVASATPMLTVTPPTLPSSGAPVRVKFDGGTYGTYREGQVVNTKDTYVLWARGGQVMKLNLLAKEGNAWLSLARVDTGEVGYKDIAAGTIMTATLPVDGDYNVSVYGNAKYQVAFEIK